MYFKYVILGHNCIGKIHPGGGTTHIVNQCAVFEIRKLIPKILESVRSRGHNLTFFFPTPRRPSNSQPTKVFSAMPVALIQTLTFHFLIYPPIGVWSFSSQTL